MRHEIAGQFGANSRAVAAAASATEAPSATTATTATVASSTEKPARLGFVDGLRALAALYVVLNHSMLEVWPSDNLPGGVTGVLAGAMQYGHLAVSVFIVLSGFSLMLPVARRDFRLPWGVWGFYWRRARRILPPYYFAMGLSLLLIWLFIGRDTGTHWDVSLPVTPLSVIEHVLLVQDFTHANFATINHAFWSIALECQIYLIFPALVLLWRRYPPLLAMAVAVALSLTLLFGLAFTWVGQLPGYTATEFAPQYIGLFAMGMFAASLYVKPTPRWTRLRNWYLWEAVTLIGCFVVVLMLNAWALFKLDLFTGMAAIGLLLAASRPGRFNLVRAALEWRPLVWLGGVSYSVYLIHAPLIQLIWQYGLHPLRLGATPTFLALLLVGLPLIVAASWVFWYFCERPFLNKRGAKAR